MPLRRKNTKMFKIPVSYEVCGEILVEAESVEDALKYAEKNIFLFELPSMDEVEYIDGSFQINSDLELVKAMNNI